MPCADRPSDVQNYILSKQCFTVRVRNNTVVYDSGISLSEILYWTM